MSNYMKPVEIVDVTLSLDTSAYADNDVLADTQAVAGMLRAPGSKGIVQSLTVIDEDDQGVAMDVLFLDANVSVGTENSAPSITDANARNVLGYVRIGSSDYIDLGGVRVATAAGLGLAIESASGGNTVYVAAITRGGTPTYTASGVRLRIGVLQD